MVFKSFQPEFGLNWTYLNVDPIGEEEDEQEKEPFNVSEAREGAYLIFFLHGYNFWLNFSPRKSA